MRNSLQNFLVTQLILQLATLNRFCVNGFIFIYYGVFIIYYGVMNEDLLQFF